MTRNPQHAMLARPLHDELALQQFSLSLKDHVRDHVRSNNVVVYERRAKRQFVAEKGREPESAQEIGTVMWQDPAYKMFSRLHRDGQEIMWASVADTLEREQGRLSEAFRSLSDPGKAKGSLELDPEFDMPPEDR